MGSPSRKSGMAARHFSPRLHTTERLRNMSECQGTYSTFTLVDVPTVPQPTSGRCEKDLLKKPLSSFFTEQEGLGEGML